ncbi:hypothetical protein GW17_00050985 [Ensete ventricosum]|nr:hypothetical protein GW17_00050985 [Ensete ventricosum]
MIEETRPCSRRNGEGGVEVSTWSSKRSVVLTRRRVATTTGWMAWWGVVRPRNTITTESTSSRPQTKHDMRHYNQHKVRRGRPPTPKLKAHPRLAPLLTRTSQRRCATLLLLLSITISQIRTISPTSTPSPMASSPLRGRGQGS